MSSEKIRGLSLLIVEDDESSQCLMRMVFEKIGCKVSVASNGKEAIDMFAVDKFDVVLMDICMPVMDGFEAAEQIRKTISKDIPIIAITSHGAEQVEERCIQAGMNSYVTKPFSKDVLCLEIARLISGSNVCR